MDFLNGIVAFANFVFVPGLAYGAQLAIGALGVTLIVLYLRSGKSAERVWAHWGFALIVGGAIGNVIDRVLFGHVIDYFLFYTQSWSFAVFNLADAFISVGAALVILDEFLEWLGERKRANLDKN